MAALLPRPSREAGFGETLRSRQGSLCFYDIAVIFKSPTKDSGFCTCWGTIGERPGATDGVSGREPRRRILDEAQIGVLPDIEIGLEEAELHLHPNVGLQ